MVDFIRYILRGVFLSNTATTRSHDVNGML